MYITVFLLRGAESTDTQVTIYCQFRFWKVLKSLTKFEKTTMKYENKQTKNNENK